MSLNKIIPGILFGALIATLIGVAKGEKGAVEIPPVVVYDFPNSSVAGREVTSSVTIIDREEIEWSGEGDVLSLISGRVPGVFVNQRGIFNYGIGPGSSGDIIIRGMGGKPNNQNLVLVDGQPTRMGIFGHPIPDAYPLEEVERVEVLRGPHCLHYGDSALGGVINIVTRKLKREEGFSTRVKAGAGEFHSYKAYLENSGRVGDFSYFASILRRETEGHRPNSAFRGWNGYAKAGYYLSEEWQMVLSGWEADFGVEDPGTVTAPRDQDLRKVERRGGGVTLYHQGDSGSGAMTLYGQSGRHDFSRVIDDGWKSHDRTEGVIAHYSRPVFAGNRLEAGGDIQEMGGEGEDVRSGRDYGSHYITQGGFYLDDRQEFAEIFTAQAGLRFQAQSHLKGQWIPRVGLRCQLSDGTVLHVQAAKGYRAPTIRDLYLFPPSSLGLKPEELWSYEIGARRNISSYLTLTLTGFYLDADNLIVYQWPEAENSGAVVKKGLETGVVFIPDDRWESMLTYTYLDQNKRVSQTVRNLLEWINRFRWGSVTLQSTTSLVRGLQFTDRQEDYCVTDLRLAWRPVQGVELSLKVNNVLDEDYQATEGYPLPGRWLWSEAAVKF